MMVLAFNESKGFCNNPIFVVIKDPEQKHGSGTALRETLQKHGMGCIGTYNNVGPIYFGHNYSSRIDWLFVSDGLFACG